MLFLASVMATCSIHSINMFLKNAIHYRAARRSRPEVEIARLACKAFRHARGRGSTPVDNLRSSDNRRSAVEVRLAPASVAEHTELGGIPARCCIDEIVTRPRVHRASCRKKVTIAAGADCAAKA